MDQSSSKEFSADPELQRAFEAGFEAAKIKFEPILREGCRLLIEHHQAGYVNPPASQECPICSKGGKEHLPNNFFGRAGEALGETFAF